MLKSRKEDLQENEEWKMKKIRNKKGSMKEKRVTKNEKESREEKVQNKELQRERKKEKIKSGQSNKS